MKSVWFCVALAGAAALAACSGNDSPAVAPPTSPRAASAPQPESPDLRKRIEIAEVGYTTSHPALALSGKVAYGEDRYSKISSPLQGRILEVRARLGDYVKPGDVLLVIDSPEITADLDRAEAEAKAFAQRYQGRLASLPGSELAAAIATFERIEETLGRVMSYAQLIFAEDATDRQQQRLTVPVAGLPSRDAVDLAPWRTGRHHDAGRGGVDGEDRGASPVVGHGTASR